MTGTREGMWFFAFLLLTVSTMRLLTLRATLWPRLGIFDWFMLSVLLVAPILALWRHLRHVREMTDEVTTTGFQLVIGGYLPLWFGFTMVESIEQVSEASEQARHRASTDQGSMGREK